MEMPAADWGYAYTTIARFKNTPARSVVFYLANRSVESPFALGIFCCWWRHVTNHPVDLSRTTVTAGDFCKTETESAVITWCDTPYWDLYTHLFLISVVIPVKFTDLKRAWNPSSCTAWSEVNSMRSWLEDFPRGGEGVRPQKIPSLG